MFALQSAWGVSVSCDVEDERAWRECCNKELNVGYEQIVNGCVHSSRAHGKWLPIKNAFVVKLHGANAASRIITVAIKTAAANRMFAQQQCKA